MARIEIVCWKDKIGGELKKETVEAFSYGFTVGPHGEWEMVIANEDKEVKKDEIVNIKIEEIEVPPKSIVLPCPVMRHALGVVLSFAGVGKPKKVEGARFLNEVLFHPIFNGTINKGQLLGVVNVFYASIERRLVRGAAERWLQERYRY